MPVTSLKISTKPAFAAFIGFATIFVSFVPADAARQYPITRAAENQGILWVNMCRDMKRANKACCKDLHKERLGHCGSVPKADQEKCSSDADGSLLYCVNEVARDISSSPSIIEDPLKVAPSSPIFRKPKLVPPSGQLGN